MRKFLCSLAVMAATTGLVLAAEVSVLSYDKDTKEVKVKNDKDEVKTYKLTDKTKVTLIDADGKETEGKLDDVTRRLGFAEKAKGMLKLDITVEGDEITAVKTKARMKKAN